VTAVQVWLTSRKYEPHKADTIVVMGAAQYDGTPSPDLAARLDEAITLYHEGWAPLIVVTGYKEKGDLYTEAQAGSAYLQQHGIPASPSWRPQAVTATRTSRRRRGTSGARRAHDPDIHGPVP